MIRITDFSFDIRRDVLGQGAENCFVGSTEKGEMT